MFFFLKFLKKLEIELPYDPAIPLLGIHTEETRRERDTCTSMFIAALFVIARHTFKCIGHLSSVLSFSGNSNALSLGNRLSNQVDLVAAEKLSPPKSLPKVMIP